MQNQTLDNPGAAAEGRDSDDERGRTYNYLRLSMIAVIVALFISLAFEWYSAKRCFLTSVSAYYHTPVRAVFVGALIAIGVSMVALWSANALADAALNLAGLLAPVVAFVPAQIDTRCGIQSANVVRQPEPAQQGAPAVRDAAHEAIVNNMRTVLVVVLVGLVLVGALRSLRPWSGAVTRRRWWTYLISYLVAWAVWIVGGLLFWKSDAFERRAHFFAAVAFFVCVIVVVGASAYERIKNDSPSDGKRNPVLHAIPKYQYVGIGLAMIASAVVIALLLRDWDHWILLLEAILIGLFGVFWGLQTIEHWASLPPAAPPGGDLPALNTKAPVVQQPAPVTVDGEVANPAS